MIYTFIEEPYTFLSNMYPCTIEYRGIIFHSSEQAYQYQKCATDEDRELILSTPHPKKTKVLARRVIIVPNWKVIKLDVMYEIVEEKFLQNPVLSKKLLSTGDKMLIEGNWWGDNFWGSCPIGSTSGENHLGQILMSARESLRLQSCD